VAFRSVAWLAILPTLTVFALYALTLATLPAAAQSQASVCPALQLDNPNPGDTVMPGGYVVSGIAFDPAVTVGSGVARVDFYLGPRENGTGIFLGSATPIPNPESFGPPRFQASLSIPKLSSSGGDFVAYAFDASTNAVTTVDIPVRLGDVPSPRGGAAQVTPTASVSSNCGAVATAVSLAPRLPEQIVFTPTPGPQLAGPPAAPTGPVADLGGPILQLGNPNAGDLLPFGGYVVSGIAYDPASTGGPGVDRVEFFLDPRENGGWFLGSAVPNTTTPGQAPTFSGTILIPKSAPKGRHIFTAYAHSSLTAAEAVVSVVVNVGAPPTPTPLPT
jgi:hypothetical protein